MPSQLVYEPITEPHVHPANNRLYGQATSERDEIESVMQFSATKNLILFCNESLPLFYSFIL
jgi:hypothetical protein